jgi:protein-tyrosine phosphatase
MATRAGYGAAVTANPVEDRDRRIAFEGCFNFRDLGGYVTADGRQVRWDALFRADGIQRLTDTDLERFRTLGILTIVDLRGYDEADLRGRLDHEALGARYHHLPLVDVVPDMTAFDPDEAADPWFVADRYRDMLAEGSRRVAAALQVLGDPGALPAVFHCSAGKDRTGIMAGIVLRLLGVSVEDVIADYAISDAAMRRLLASAADRSQEAADTLARYPSAMLQAQPDNMARFLGRIESQHGSMAGFVASIGVEDAVVDRLRSALLEP